MSKIYTAADQLIGHTPLLELTHIEKEQQLPAHIIAKLEYFNPAGSVKDRIAVIDDGRIIELGSHDELMARNGAYAALVRTQELKS